MATFSVLKFWKSTTTKVAVDGDVDNETIPDSIFSDPMTEFSDDDDDSFFELELSLPKYNSSSNPTNTNLAFDKATHEPNKFSSKPQSPISILRSASPKLSVFMLSKFTNNNKKVSSRKDEDKFDTTSSSNCSPTLVNSGSSMFTVKFRIEDGSIVPKLMTSMNSSSNLLSSPKTNNKQNSNESSKRFSRDVVTKYLNFVKPLYVKTARKSAEGGEMFGMGSPKRASPKKDEKQQSSRFKVKGKEFGKSKSSSAMIGGSSPVRVPPRNDHPCENIEGAILHCKRSLNTSSKGRSSLSRCSSDPSHDKSSQVSEEI